MEDYVAAGGQGMLTMQLWGGNDESHHVKALFNGVQVADLFFADQEVEDFAGAVDLQEGANTLTLHVPNDQGAEFDRSLLEDYGLIYPRALWPVMTGDQLQRRG